MKFPTVVVTVMVTLLTLLTTVPVVQARTFRVHHHGRHSHYKKKPIIAQARYYVVKQTCVKVNHDKQQKHRYDEVYATNRPDVFKPNHQYKMVFTYHDRNGRLKVKSITRRVLDSPGRLGGKPNLEICLNGHDRRTILFVKEHLNMRMVKVYEV